MAQQQQGGGVSLGDIETLLILAALGVGGYFLYQLISSVTKLPGAAASAAKQAGAAVSKALVPNPTATAVIVLDSPAGAQIPYSAAKFGFSFWGDTFTYNGNTYKLVSQNPDATNTYYALIQTPASSSSSSGGMGPVAPGASIILGDGTEIPLSAATNMTPTTLEDGTASATFVYGGTKYQFTGPADDTGTYYAYAIS